MGEGAAHSPSRGAYRSQRTQGLEEGFDGAKCRNLRHFVTSGLGDKIARRSGGDVAISSDDDEASPARAATLYYIAQTRTSKR